MNWHHRPKSKILTSLKFVIAVSLAGFSLLIILRSSSSELAHAESSDELLEQALYTRQEFFGVEAIVPLPTLQARDNLLHLLQTSPNEPTVIGKLSELEEKLGNYDEAERDLKQLVAIDRKYGNQLTMFYEHRGRYEDEAAQLRQRLVGANADERPAIFGSLLAKARTHGLKQYLGPVFFHEVISQNADVYPVFQGLIEQLTIDENYSEALQYVRQAESQFPDEKAELLQKEIELLHDVGKEKEAVEVYIRAYDPFWTAEKAEKFYQFLNDNDRLRDYTSSLKTRFKKDPSDFDAAIRLASYRHHLSQDISPILLRLEKAKTSWTTDELLTVTRFLLGQRNLSLGSRYLYTLYNRPEMKTSGEERSRILYQLFRIFDDAENQRLPITRGDLDYYLHIATIDTDPGIATGILSLLFSDSGPAAELDVKENIASGYFNRAAAYRIFLAYKQENSTSPELAQMYLDIVRLYAGTEQNDVAKQALDDFAARYKRSNDFRIVALKLADAYAAVKDVNNTREIYREILASYANQEIIETDRSPKQRKSDLGKRIHNAFGDEFQSVSYGEVLERLVDSLAKDKLTPDILAAYSQEISKHPNTEWLYAARLKWLDETNLTDDQLAAYRQALDKFQTASWRDKLARWFLRNDRQADFERFSTDLISKLDEGETRSYLGEFINSNITAKDFQKELYLKLYRSALIRFPHGETFVTGLLNFYAANKREDDWRKLAATYYFEMPSVRKLFVARLTGENELRSYFAAAKQDSLIYKLFRADASTHLSEFENAVAAYREMNRLYPNTPEFAETLVTLTRSLGQKDSSILKESADVASSRAEFDASSSVALTRSGEIYEEAGDVSRARSQWNKLIDTASGERETYLETATVFWDYFHYGDALYAIEMSRTKFDDKTLCAFEAGAIQESLHEKPAAIHEYIKALASADYDQSDKSARRLAKLTNANRLGEQIAAAFTSEHSQTSGRSRLALGYANYLLHIEKPEEAEQLLTKEVSASSDDDFLADVRSFAEENDLGSVDRAALKRLGAITETPRRKIAFSIELADSLSSQKKRDEAKAVLADLIRMYPTNYGVVMKTSDLYKRLGFDEDSLAVLRNALPLSKGEYTAQIAAKLSTRLIQLNQLDEAEALLIKLRAKDVANVELFRGLAQIYVRKSTPDLLHAVLKETIAELKRSNTDRRELDSKIVDLRTEMIDAFTRLKDPRSAIEQHIELINREPDDKELVDNAIAYAKRYGGGDTLLAYYQKTATEAFKNYRWNVVLARIYDANSDAENAVRQYQTAIVSQPEMPELYIAVADLETRRRNYSAAIKNIDQVLKLTNDDPAYIRKKVAILKKASRNAEAAALQAKLPPERPIKPANENGFSDAEKLAADQRRDEALESYRRAFDALSDDPLHGEMTAADIAAYVTAVREVEPLDRINAGIWMLREKLQAIAIERGSETAGGARKRIHILDGALVETVGNILKTAATDDEIKATFEDLARRTETVVAGSEGEQTLDLIMNISRKAGMGMLEEKILQKRLVSSQADMQSVALRNLVNFYDSRGAYARSFETIERIGFDDPEFVAEHARLVGQTDKEITALRSIYEKPSEKLSTSPNTAVSRYLQLLYTNDRDELYTICGRSSAYQLQLINFLLGKGERELAHLAIENASLSPAWKLSRNAETANAFHEYGDVSECYFCDALQLVSIGDMTAQAPDKRRFLVGDDWFRLAREYGEWLGHSPQKANESSSYLTALIELHPHSAEAQTDLGLFYLNEKQMVSAVEHFRIAYELDPNSTPIMSDLGSAYYIGGSRVNADEMWRRALEDASPEQMISFFDTLSRFRLENEARAQLTPRIVDFLKKNNIGASNEDMDELVRKVARSFTDKRAEAAYFAAIMNQRPNDTSLAEFLINESLIDKKYVDTFFERLISHTDADEFDDYEFRNIIDRAWSYDAAESIYDQESEYKTTESEDDHYKWRQKFIESLIDRHEDGSAATEVRAVEAELHGRYARPAWLRIAKLRLALRMHSFPIAVAEQLVGITVDSSVKEIKPPDIDRYNDVVKMLREEKAVATEQQLAEAYFARQLAIGQYDKSNFDGLAGTFFQKHNPAGGTRILQLMVDAANDETRPTALAALIETQEIKARTVDLASGDQTSIDYARVDALDLAARTSAEFGELDAAIAFRRQLLAVEPRNAANRLELAKQLVGAGDKRGATDLLGQLAMDRTATRADRWRAKWQLTELEPKTLIPNIAFDSSSQYYVGLLTVPSDKTAAEADFINSLIDAGDQNGPAADELIKLYAVSDRPYAALKLAETFKHERSDDLNETLSKAAEETDDYERAISYEQAMSGGGDRQRIEKLKRLQAIASTQAVSLTVDLNNTRQL
jgi:cytochrome c-type biogenesis protein CcmH/NrfG/thioredoxin-like negative regulator of GroEL